MVIVIFILSVICFVLYIVLLATVNQLNKTIRSINSMNRSIKKIQNDMHGYGRVIDLELQMICANSEYLGEMKKDLSIHAKAIDKFGRMAITASNHAALVNTEWIKMNNKHVKKEGEKR